MKKFNVILATDLNGAIGLNNDLPWEFDSDMGFFRTITKTKSILPGINTSPNILIMGRNTWESLNKSCLPNRLNYVITSKFNQMENYDNTLFFENFYQAYLTASKNIDSDIWVIGGKQIYDTAIKHWACEKIYWTKIDGIFEADVFINLNDYKINWTNQFTKNDINKKDGKQYDLIFNLGTPIPNIETQYLETLYDVIKTGEKRMTRNGFTYSKFNKTLSWDLADGFPLLTTKKMFWKGIVEELLFFIRGETNSKLLSDKGVKIWEPNTNKEFLDKMGFDYPVGEMGPMYGYQWRYFNKPYPETDENKHIKGVDQMVKVINEIKSDPYSRRILLTDFNPGQAHQGVLYPCHSIIIQFYVQEGRLSCSMYQRSGDLFLGIPFNIASTSLLLHIISQLTGLQPGKVNLIIGDYHIYEQHTEAVLEQLSRTAYDLPKLVMNNFNSLEQIEKASWTDFKIENYQSHPAIKAQMIA
jgi:dihydrofolate reductase/thymidylate synthase